jgi:6,7-dimethyl-8-ribityllumazine synthase
MAGDLSSPDVAAPVPDGSGLKVAVIGARFNSAITVRLLDGVRRGLRAAKVRPADVVEEWVPGAFELPLAAQTFAESGDVDAVICIGCVIRGETTHYEAVAGECAGGIQRAQLSTGVPIVFGVLTTETPGQALARSEGPGGHNVGEEGAAVAVEMARLVTRIRERG